FTSVFASTPTLRYLVARRWRQKRSYRVFSSLQTNALDQVIKARVIAHGVKTWFHFQHTHPRLACLIRFLKAFERLILVPDFSVQNRALEIRYVWFIGLVLKPSNLLKQHSLPS